MAPQVSLADRLPRPRAIYHFSDWKMMPPSRLPSEAERIVYRPSVKTLACRLVISAYAGGFAAALFYWSPRLQIVTQYRGALTACMVVGALATLFAVLFPVSCLWIRFVLDRDFRGGFVVQSGYIFPSPKTWPAGSFSRITIRAQSVARGKGKVDYEWRVCLEGSAKIEFGPDSQKDPPTPGQLSPRTAQFVSALQRLTGLTCEVPVIVDSGADALSGDGSSSLSFVQTEAQRFTSLDEVPEELRAEFSQLQAEAMAKPPSLFGPTTRTATHVTREIRVIEQDGSERTYHSLEEMPPELRARFESGLAHAKPVSIPPEGVQVNTFSGFTFRDAHGRKRTYNSVDEMPPEVRALYERICRNIGER